MDGHYILSGKEVKPDESCAKSQGTGFIPRANRARRAGVQRRDRRNGYGQTVLLGNGLHGNAPDCLLGGVCAVPDAAAAARLIAPFLGLFGKY